MFQILAIVRAQWKLNSVWESVLAMCHKKWKGSASIEVKLTPAIDASGIECSFSANNTVHIGSELKDFWKTLTGTFKLYLRLIFFSNYFYHNG